MGSIARKWQYFENHDCEFYFCDFLTWRISGRYSRRPKKKSILKGAATAILKDVFERWRRQIKKGRSEEGKCRKTYWKSGGMFELPSCCHMQLKKDKLLQKDAANLVKDCYSNRHQQVLQGLIRHTNLPADDELRMKEPSFRLNTQLFDILGDKMFSRKRYCCIGITGTKIIMRSTDTSQLA